jgi:hypothetical protein
MHRITKALLAGAGAAAAYYTGSALGATPQARAIGRGSVLLLAGTAALAATGTAIKGRTTSQRLDAHVIAAAPAINLQANGGTIGGNVVVAGDHHVQGSLYGVGGTLSVGDAVHVAGAPLTADGTITSHADMLAVGGTVDGGAVVSGGTISAGGTISNTSGNINAAGNFNGTKVQCSASTGDTAQGGASNPPTQAQVNACINRVNDILAAIG